MKTSAVLSPFGDHANALIAEQLLEIAVELTDFLDVHASTPAYDGGFCHERRSMMESRLPRSGAGVVEQLIHRARRLRATRRSPTTLAGTPATVTLFGTGLMTTEPAAMRAQWPISILPRILAPAPISTPRRIFGMAVPVLLAGAAERHVVQDRDIVLDDRGLADHEAGGVIEEDAAADPGSRIDVALEHRRRAALQIEREVLAALAPAANAPGDASGWRGSL